MSVYCPTSAREDARSFRDTISSWSGAGMSPSCDLLPQASFLANIISPNRRRRQPCWWDSRSRADWSVCPAPYTFPLLRAQEMRLCPYSARRRSVLLWVRRRPGAPSVMATHAGNALGSLALPAAGTRDSREFRTVSAHDLSITASPPSIPSITFQNS